MITMLSHICVYFIELHYDGMMNDVQCSKSFWWCIFLTVTVIDLFFKIKIGIFNQWKLVHVEINLKCTVHKYYLTIYYYLIFKVDCTFQMILHYLQSLFIHLINFAILSYSFAHDFFCVLHPFIYPFLSSIARKM